MSNLGLTEENMQWLETAAADLDSTPAALLNSVLRSIREELGRPGAKPFADWVAEGRRVERELLGHLAQWRTSRSVTEEAVRAARLYLQRIESARPKTAEEQP